MVVVVFAWGGCTLKVVVAVVVVAIVVVTLVVCCSCVEVVRLCDRVVVSC